MVSLLGRLKSLLTLFGIVTLITGVVGGSGMLSSNLRLHCRDKRLVTGDDPREPCAQPDTGPRRVDLPSLHTL